MPLFLKTLITSLFGGLVDFFSRILGRKLGLGVVFLTLMLGLISAFIFALNLAIEGVSYTMPSFLNDSFGYVMPSNTLLCITAVYSAQVARFVFDTNKDIVSGQMRLFS